MKNLKIEKRQKRAELSLNPVFYPEDVVEKAIKDFSGVFDTKFERDGERINIKLKLIARGVGIEDVTYKFINYLLAEVKNSEVNAW